VAQDRPGASPTHVVDLAVALRSRVRGDVRFDRLSRTLYATDASIYEIIPAGVVCPKDADDVVASVEICGARDESIIARGAATGLAGGAVGAGVQLDLSRHLRGVRDLDVEHRTVRVEPGVVLDELNAQLAPHGLMFAPDVATSSRATIGGMIANNACGARSVRYGRTVDHVRSLTVVSADAQVVTLHRDPDAARDAHARRLEDGLGAIRDAAYPEIERRFPKLLRSNGGYGLDRLGPPGTPADATKILCGSEGTLGIVVDATLSLEPLPAHRAVVLLTFQDLLDALGATPAILTHRPSAVELIDDLILQAGRRNATLARACSFIPGDPGGMMAVEFMGDDAEGVLNAVEALAMDGDVIGRAVHVVKLLGAEAQVALWNLRKSGLGLLMSQPGDEQAYAFIEDTVVEPRRLQEYIARLRGILDREGVRAGCYAHASVGCLHVRPVLNLKTDTGVATMKRIAETVFDLALEFRGTISGEHGDGIVRSSWLEKMYGERLIQAFREVKALFDPYGRLNPGKIVDPLPMTDNLRYGGGFAKSEVKTTLDFSLHDGPAGLAGMCSGVGQCRQTLTGTMCPSYVATLDERHTTRARANALRVALSNRGLLSGLGDDALDEVMDLCVSCKACKSECPTGVDMARLKSEFRSARNLRDGAPRRARLIADAPAYLARAARFPQLVNLVSQSRVARHLFERRYGLDARVPPPKLAGRSFRDWYKQHRRVRRPDAGSLGSRGAVIYFVDTWTNYITPTVGIAAVSLLEAAGFDVHCPKAYCCGRPAISQGLLSEARQLARWNIVGLASSLDADVPILFTEPSCWSAFVDEYPQLVPAPLARRVAARSHLLDSFLRRVLEDAPDALTFQPRETPLLLHVHCHQRALAGADGLTSLLRDTLGDGVCELDAGCCGMAGAFGHEHEHYDVAKAIGEHRLFPRVRAREDGDVAVTGFSCRHQITHHTDARPRHAIEYLVEACRPDQTDRV